MNWQPNRSLPLSLSKQIVQWMTEQIESGEWPIGTKLPPQRKLALSFGVNRSTLQEAIDELKANGLLSSKTGSATYVSNDSWNVLVKQKQTNWQQYIEASIHKSNFQTIQLINEFEQDDSVIRLGTGELNPLLLPSAAIHASLSGLDLDGKTIGYSSPQGSLSLRQAICSYVQKRGIVTSPENICIVSGALQALQLISVGLLETGSFVLQDRFSYLNSIHTFQSFGMHLYGLSEHQYTLDMIQRIRRNRQAILYTIPTLHNPTGNCMTIQQKKELYALCESAQLPIIEDDVYCELLFDEEPTPAMKAFDQTGGVLYIGSVSKTLSPGLRIGWVIASTPVIQRLADIKMQMDYGSSAISQQIVEHWLRTGLYERHIEQLKIELQRRAELMDSLLQQHFQAIASWEKPKGGFYIWIKFHEPIVTTDLFMQLLKNKVLINPGYIYAANDAHHIRLSFAYGSDAELEQGIEILYQQIQTNKHR
ncbi:aminotransferase-like domain-containing protein [Paenibacillus radicis (ex Gao et al. 2016)]|uniref:HTH-type transcriptional regulator NorG n=1 Tax=Paenibacillus radicis (ex Gao et al. 2016) TaxID=1737354 RepID=A0A917GXJ9_9BACL|nr:PLP-dependent aminotransferase family protein [Paenibacillus radicis (ex Gao et al. 2016)]GGG60291.1 putative HTH-type transcriptional regulator YisV [Paenibacillus radicis (ex Gao et al. 2016)]